MEKLISLDSGSDMLALQAFMFFVEIPSIPVVFTLDFSSFVYFHGRLVESRNVVHSQILKKLKKHFGVFRYPRGRGHYQCTSYTYIIVNSDLIAMDK